MTKSQIGSLTAKGGFLNEADICKKIINFQHDTEAKQWLEIMGYNPNKIDSVVATQIPTRINKKKAIGLGISEERYEETIKYKKADVQVRIEIVIDDIVYIENISLKKANRTAGFNQVDKRAVSTYKKMWFFDDEIEHWLKLFTGEILPSSVYDKEQLSQIKDKKKRRLFLTEIPPNALEQIIDFFTNNKLLVISDILKGRGGLSAEWFLVTRKDTQNRDKIDWVLKDINTTCNFYAQGEVKMSPRGSLKIGRVTMQRKGGTPDPTSLQFKINPLELFNA
jgi:hypothetical protein